MLRYIKGKIKNDVTSFARGRDVDNLRTEMDRLARKKDEERGGPSSEDLEAVSKAMIVYQFVLLLYDYIIN